LIGRGGGVRSCAACMRRGQMLARVHTLPDPVAILTGCAQCSGSAILRKQVPKKGGTRKGQVRGLCVACMTKIGDTGRSHVTMALSHLPPARLAAHTPPATNIYPLVPTPHAASAPLLRPLARASGQEGRATYKCGCGCDQCGGGGPRCSLHEKLQHERTLATLGTHTGIASSPLSHAGPTETSATHPHIACPSPRPPGLTYTHVVGARTMRYKCWSRA
jgi:hypothetical protein